MSQCLVVASMLEDLALTPLRQISADLGSMTVHVDPHNVTWKGRKAKGTGCNSQHRHGLVNTF
jgi:hypothetical protein